MVEWLEEAYTHAQGIARMVEWLDQAYKHERAHTQTHIHRAWRICCIGLKRRMPTNASRVSLIPGFDPSSGLIDSHTHAHTHTHARAHTHTHTLTHTEHPTPHTLGSL